MLFAYAMSWANACVGLSVGDPESAQGIGFILIFPLAFISTCFVPSQTMPGGCSRSRSGTRSRRSQPRVRELFGNPNPAALSHSFAAQHPVFMALAWSAVICAVCVPLANHLFRKRTLD